jgi:hypothetical protein
MFSRIRLALGLALSLALFTAITGFAKGGFAFIAVSGADLKGEVRLSDPALTQGFFTFADFYRNKTEAPANPGVGYEITRYYVDGKRETAFDTLHYYPETGYVYYDGIANGGSSEYDGKWYTAVPEIKSTFETALNTELRLVALGNPEAAEAVAQEQANMLNEAQPVTASTPGPQPMVLLLVTAGLAVLVAIALRLRRPSLDKRPKGG